VDLPSWSVGVWIGQGAGFIKGSFMTGSSTWLAIGLLCLVVGLLLIFLSVRRRPKDTPDSDR
jgi:hypothetical protein